MHQDPDGPCREQSKAAKGSQKRPRSAGAARTIHDSGFHGFLNHGSRITVVSCRVVTLTETWARRPGRFPGRGPVPNLADHKTLPNCANPASSGSHPARWAALRGT